MLQKQKFDNPTTEEQMDRLNKIIREGLLQYNLPYKMSEMLINKKAEFQNILNQAIEDFANKTKWEEMIDAGKFDCDDYEFKKYNHKHFSVINVYNLRPFKPNLHMSNMHLRSFNEKGDTIEKLRKKIKNMGTTAHFLAYLAEYKEAGTILPLVHLGSPVVDEDGHEKYLTCKSDRSGKRFLTVTNMYGFDGFDVKTVFFSIF
jgi:hypothetical protein